MGAPQQIGPLQRPVLSAPWGARGCGLKVSVTSVTATQLLGDLIGSRNNSRTSASLSSFFAFLLLQLSLFKQGKKKKVHAW